MGVLSRGQSTIVAGRYSAAPVWSSVQWRSPEAAVGPVSDGRPVMRLRRTGLWHHRDFLRFWAAQSVSHVGTQISLLALPLMAALTLDASPFEVGVLAAAGQAPMLLVGLFAGAWVDRRLRRPVMMIADLGRAAVLLVIPIAAAFDALSMGVLYAVAFIAGTLTVFFDVSYLS